jgi:hypothetical protein
VYKDGQSNVKCEFCSNLISTPSIKRKSIQTEHVSRIKSKPHIVPPKEKKILTVPNFSELHNKVRVDDGWIVHFKNRLYNVSLMFSPSEMSGFFYVQTIILTQTISSTSLFLALHTISDVMLYNVGVE